MTIMYIFSILIIIVMSKYNYHYFNEKNMYYLSCKVFIDGFLF